MDAGSFFDYENFMPHGMCYLWQSNILWTTVIADVVTALAYYSITIAVIVFVRRRKDLPCPWFFILAGSVIFMACGTSHLIGAMVIWQPIYGVSAVMKAITAVTSMATGVVIWFVLPFFLALPSPEMLKKKNISLQQSLDKLRATQKQLIESEKLAGLGNLISGMAHELNTPIGVSITATSCAEDHLNRARGKNLNPEKMDKLLTNVTESLSIALRNLERSVDLVTLFKNVAANQVAQSDQPFQLKELITDIFETLQQKVNVGGHRIDLDCPDELQVKCCKSDLIHIITHLVENSVQHGFISMAQGRISLKVRRKGGVIQLRYGDDGCGMNDALVAKIFEPFFTTCRGVGGPGLGMTVVYNTVARLNGCIICKSHIGEGTKFAIELPIRLMTDGE